MSTYNSRWQAFFATTRQSFLILRCLNSQDELWRLVKWADRKRLPGPHRAYLIKLDDAERKLFRYTVFSPRLTALAHFVHGFKILLTPTPRYLPRGSGACTDAQKLDMRNRNPIV